MWMFGPETKVLALSNHHLPMNTPTLSPAANNLGADDNITTSRYTRPKVHPVCEVFAMYTPLQLCPIGWPCNSLVHHRREEILTWPGFAVSESILDNGSLEVLGCPIPNFGILAFHTRISPYVKPDAVHLWIVLRYPKMRSCPALSR